MTNRDQTGRQGSPGGVDATILSGLVPIERPAGEAPYLPLALLPRVALAGCRACAHVPPGPIS